MTNSKLKTQNSKLCGSLAQELEVLQARGLFRYRRVLQTPQGVHVKIDGKDLVSFASNDYLGLADHPKLREAACEGIDLWGVGGGASHLICGYHAAHEALEDALAKFVALPRALVFSAGYMANIGVITALVGRGDAVFADRLNHASLNDAAVLSRAEFKRYRHGDIEALECALSQSKARRKLVVTDAVFSMDGDIAPLPALVDLCTRHDAWLLVDDAHGFGAFGVDGRGALSHFGIASSRVIYMATLGKAAGVCGAFVAAKNEVVETLVQRARTYIYTTATPPLLAHALLVSLELIRRDAWRRARLSGLIRQLRTGLRLRKWRLLPSQTPIQPIVIGGNEDAMRASNSLLAEGIFVPAIRPPTVRPNEARLRISLSAAHSGKDVDRLIEALHANEQ